MKITRQKDSLQIEKPEGTKVSYYLFPEYEIHYNEQLPHTTQMWHHHETVWETLMVLEGQLTAHWREDGKEKETILQAGDMVENERTPHTFSNDTDKVVKFIVFKQVLSGKDKKEILKADKVLDQ